MKLFSRTLALCRGDVEYLTGWISRWSAVPRSVGLIVLGCGAYGFAMGFSRSPMMGVYVALKLPMLVLLVVGMNGFINGLLAQLLGTNLSFRQTLNAILASFALFGVIMGALSPAVLFLSMSFPVGQELSSSARVLGHAMALVVHTGLIGYAGLLAMLKLRRLMLALCGSTQAALKTFLAWLLGNVFLGAQLAYVLRPFFGTPGLEVAFLRDRPLEGNFYVALWRSLVTAQSNLSASAQSAAVLVICALAIGMLLLYLEDRKTL